MVRRLATHADRGTPECVICFANEASVVFVPCNHFIMCEQCVDLHRRQQNAACPLCRREVDYDRNFSLLTN